MAHIYLTAFTATFMLTKFCLSMMKHVYNKYEHMYSINRKNIYSYVKMTITKYFKSVCHNIY